MKQGDTFENEFDVNKHNIDLFINLSNDKNPLHTNDKFAKDHGFDKRVVHGNLQNVFLSYFVGEMLPFKNVVIINQTISYHNPMYENDIVNLISTVSNVIESVSVFEFTFLFQNNNKKKLSTGKISIKLI